MLIPALRFLCKAEQLSLFGPRQAVPVRAHVRVDPKAGPVPVQQHIEMRPKAEPTVEMPPADAPRPEATPVEISAPAPVEVERSTLGIEDAPETSPVVEPEEDAAPEHNRTQAERSGRSRHHDAGEHLAGSRADRWAYIDAHNLDALELEGPAAAWKHVTKESVFGEGWNVDAWRAMGDTPGAAYLKNEFVKSIVSRPDDDPRKRAAYVEACQTLQRKLDQAHTLTETYEVLQDYSEERRGSVRVGDWEDEEPWLAKYGRDETRRHYSVDAKGFVGEPYTVRLTDYKLTPHGHYTGYTLNNKTRYAALKPMPRADALGATTRIQVWGKRADGFVIGNTDSARKHRHEAERIEAAEDWSWSGTKAPARDKAGPLWQRSIRKPERRGGRPVDPGWDAKRLIDTFGFRGVQFGNYVDDDDAQTHVDAAATALIDLADVLGLDPMQITHHHALGLAFGARGSGSHAAHYEPDKRVINLTKSSGIGTLAHEWSHFCDNVLAGGEGKPRWLSDGTGKLVHPDVARAFGRVMHAIEYKPDAGESYKLRESDPQVQQRLSELQAAIREGRTTYTATKEPTLREVLRNELNAKITEYNSLTRTDSKMRGRASRYSVHAGLMGDYWSRPWELFARASEAFVEDELQARGQANTYLVHGTQREYRVNRKGIDCEPYPQGVERAAINTAMREFWAAVARTDALQKALDGGLSRVVGHMRGATIVAPYVRAVHRRDGTAVAHVYHGSPRVFDAFKPDAAGLSYFAYSRGVSRDYGRHVHLYSVPVENTLDLGSDPFDVKPLCRFLRRHGHQDLADAVEAKAAEPVIEGYEGDNSAVFTFLRDPAIAAAIRSSGHDSVSFTDNHDGEYHPRVLAVFPSDRIRRRSASLGLHKAADGGLQRVKAHIREGRVVQPYTRLYRGDARHIERYDIDRTDPKALLGRGVYVTENKRIAGDYRAKGNTNAVFHYHGARGKVSKADVVDVYTKRLATTLDEDGKDLSWPEELGAMWETTPQGVYQPTDARSQARLRAARARWTEMEPTHEVRVGADGHAMIVERAPDAAGEVSAFHVPQRVLAQCIDADTDVDDDVVDAMAEGFRPAYPYGSNREMRRALDSRVDEDGDVQTPTLRELWSELSGRGDWDESAARRALRRAGYAGLKYEGGITIGGAGHHTCYVLWDAHKMHRYRVAAGAKLAKGAALVYYTDLDKAERLRGGRADGRDPSDFDAEELARGIREEREHTDDDDVAREIAMDHLAENPHYYSEEELRKAEQLRLFGAQQAQTGPKQPVRVSPHQREGHVVIGYTQARAAAAAVAATIARPTPTPSPITPGMSLDVAEDAIRNESHEHAGIFTPSGELIGTGGPTYTRALGLDPTMACMIDPAVLADPRVDGAILTHNHPSNAPVSGQDFRLAHNLNLSEMRACTSAGCWVLTRPAVGWAPITDALEWFTRAAKHAHNSACVLMADDLGPRAAQDPDRMLTAEESANYVRYFAEGFDYEFEVSDDLRRHGYRLRFEPVRPGRGGVAAPVPDAIAGDDRGGGTAAAGAEHALNKGERLRFRAGLHLDPLRHRWVRDEDIRHGAVFPTPLGDVRVEHEDADKVRLRPAGGGAAVEMPRASASHFYNDLAGSLAGHNPTSGDADVDGVIRDHEDWLGKGNDGIVFGHDAAVVKVSTTVPYQPFNEGHRTPAEAAQHMRDEATAYARLAGIPGVPTVRAVEHEGRVWLVKPRLSEAGALSLAELDSIKASVSAMHARGLIVGDTIQLGREPSGALQFMDLGQSRAATPAGAERDLERLEELYREHGHELYPTGDKLRRKERARRLLLNAALRRGSDTVDRLYAEWLPVAQRAAAELATGSDDTSFDAWMELQDEMDRLRDAIAHREAA